jgi:hypothetical protein
MSLKGATWMVLGACVGHRNFEITAMYINSRLAHSTSHTSNVCVIMRTTHTPINANIVFYQTVRYKSCVVFAGAHGWQRCDATPLAGGVA